MAKATSSTNDLYQKYLNIQRRLSRRGSCAEAFGQIRDILSALNLGLHMRRYILGRLVVFAVDTPKTLGASLDNYFGIDESSRGVFDPTQVPEIERRHYAEFLAYASRCGGLDKIGFSQQFADGWAAALSIRSK